MRLSTKLTIGVLGIALALAAGLFALKQAPAAEIMLTVNPPPPEEPAVFVPYVQLGRVRVPVAIADEGPEITKGLSGRASLPEDEGMFFVFQNPDRYRFWMPDMHFPIDIIWIEGGKVVGVAENVSNEFDAANPKFYLSPVLVKYVLEVNAGFAAAHGIGVGTSVATYLSADH